MQKYGGKWVKSKRHRKKKKKRERKLEKSAIVPGLVEGGEEKRKRRRKKRRKKVGENNGQLRFVRHHGWHTQARLDQNIEELGKYCNHYLSSLLD